MPSLRLPLLAAMLLLASAGSASAIDGLITKRSAHPAAETLDRLEAALKQQGFIVFARLDHGAAAASVGSKMPISVVVAFGNPRVGTPVFIEHPTIAIDLPLKALVWEDAAGGVFVSYNSAPHLLVTIYHRHGVPTNPDVLARLERQLTVATDTAVTKEK